MTFVESNLPPSPTSITPKSTCCVGEVLEGDGRGQLEPGWFLDFRPANPFDLLQDFFSPDRNAVDHKTFPHRIQMRLGKKANLVAGILEDIG